MSDLSIPTSNAPDVFDAVQSASLSEVNDSTGASAGYATQFRPGSSVDSGAHVDGSGGQPFSDAQQSAIDFFNAQCAAQQAAINGGRNGVVTSGYVNYGDSTESGVQ